MHDGEFWDWQALAVHQQPGRRQAYGRYRDGLPPTAVLHAKVDRLRRRLAEHAIAYSHHG